MAQQSLYDVLGVSASAEPLEIQKAFRAKMLKLHPDHGSTNHQAFADVVRAYQILSDSKKRAEYDRGETVTSLLFGTQAGRQLMKRMLPSAPIEPIRGEDLYLPVLVSPSRLQSGTMIEITVDGKRRSVEIPPQADMLQFCRIPQAGKPGRNGALPGDLFLIVFTG